MIFASWQVSGAVTKWKVVFDINGGQWTGDPLPYIEIEDNQPLGTMPQNVNNTGTTFLGWSKEQSGGALADSDTKITEDTRLYAQWATTSCKVTFNANGGAWADGTTNDKILINPKDASLGGNKPDAPSREGFTFEGWKDESGNIVEDSQIGNIIIASDREFTAHWISTLPVTDKEPPKTTTPPPTTSQQAVKAQVKSFGVTQKTIYVKRGKKVKLPLIAYTTAPGKQVVKWKASKPKVASVKKGKKTGTVKLNGNKNAKLTIKAGKKLGTSKITLTAASGKKLVIKVKVVKQLKKVCAASVKIKKLSAKKAKRLKVGQVKRLVAKFTKKATAIATWKSSKPKVVKIDAAGRITVLKKGTAKITLKVGGKKKTLKIRVR
jgi:uncharacterized repeat protein (TIGR02543 family)